MVKSKLLEYVAEVEQNGVKQHSEEWQRKKLLTVSGSILSLFQGVKSPYHRGDELKKLLQERLGLTLPKSGTAMHFGNLFESLNKAYTEHHLKTEILGSDLYIFSEDRPSVSYSPDGLGLVDTCDLIDPDKILPADQVIIVLFEFKCPISRIPDGNIPSHYKPQVKMGLNVIPIVSHGIFADAMFRRCSWRDLGNTKEYDKKMAKDNFDLDPLAFGFIGFYLDTEKITDMRTRLSAGEKINHYGTTLAGLNSMMRSLDRVYLEDLEIGDESNDYMSNDLGECDKPIFDIILAAYDLKILAPWYGPISYTDSPSEDGHVAAKYAFERECREKCRKNYGILPWKLLMHKLALVEPEHNYIEPWLPKINEFVGVVRRGLACATHEEKLAVYNEYFGIVSQFGDEL